MKHIIPTLTLTALAAAASAQQAAAPAGLNYNSITLSRTSRENALAVQFNPSGSNFVIGFAADGNSTGSNGQLSAGYVFKGVTLGIDATVGVIQGQDTGAASVYTLTLRRALNEVYQGLEIAAGAASTLSSDNASEFVHGGTSVTAENSSYIEVSYALNKTFSVAAGITKPEDANSSTVFSVRAGF